jgi:hypothetical protein
MHMVVQYMLKSLYTQRLQLSKPSPVTLAAPHHQCLYCHLDTAQMLARQCGRSCSDITVGTLKVLLAITTGYIDSLTYIIQPYTH